MTTERRYAPIGRGFFPENDYTVSGDWVFTGTVTFDDPIGTFEPGPHDHSADEITSGQFADALIAQSSVTQYQSALSIAYSQITGAPEVGVVDWADITGKPSFFTPSPHTHDLGTDIYGSLLSAHFPATLSISTDLTVDSFVSDDLTITSLTGLLQADGGGLVSAITDSSTVGHVLTVTGAATYAWQAPTGGSGGGYPEQLGYAGII